jgi:uroporphyrinogen-III decarboxylase
MAHTLNLMYAHHQAACGEVLMVPKERLMTALSKEKPDRLPISVHQWQDYHLKYYLNGISAIEAFRKFGMDAQIQYFGDTAQTMMSEYDSNKYSSPGWREEIKVISSNPDDHIEHHAIRTPAGTLTYQTRGDRRTTWITEYIVKHDEDIELIDKYMPVPKLALAPVRAVYDAVGDQGILRGFVWGDQGGCWQHACCLMDMAELIMRCVDRPDWVHRFLTILLNKKLRFIETMKGAKFDLVETGGGAASSTVISPAIHKEFCTPYDRKMHDALHALGFKVTYHTCGGTRGIEELIVANGADASETLAPVSIGGNQEPWEFKGKIGNRLALIGGVDQFNVLTSGPGEKIRKAVHTLFETVGKEGGYICAACDHFFDTPLENIRALTDAARECVYY